MGLTLILAAVACIAPLALGPPSLVVRLIDVNQVKLMIEIFATVMFWSAQAAKCLSKGC